MVQSDEHRFITSTFIDLVSELSNSELYGYLEADRGGFDFACMLERDRSRPLVGQTLRHHSSGIEKDLNWLIFDQEAEIPVYLYSDNARNVTRIRDTLHRMQSHIATRSSLLRLYSYPAEFDADDESQRDTVRSILREKITDDLLMNILFGQLTAADVAMFLSATNIPGLLLSCLEEFATNGMLNYSDLANRLGAKSATVRTRVQMLWASGMVQHMQEALVYRLTQRARVFLKICNLVWTDTPQNPELSYVLSRLGLSDTGGNNESYESISERYPVTGVALEPEVRFIYDRSQTGTRLFRDLLFEIWHAKRSWGVEISGGPYPIDQVSDGLPAHMKSRTWVGR